MPRVFHDDDAPLEPLSGETIAVIGYGNQGRSWALNLRDSGLDVVVGTISDASRETAASEGFPAHEIPDAARAANLVCLLVPDEVMSSVVREHVVAGLSEGDALCFASGYAVAFDEVEVPAGVDVLLLAPRMLGTGVRETYVDGSGFISFVNVERDASGRGWPRCLALARGIGATRRGALELDAHKEALIDLFIEQGIAPAVMQVWREGALVLLEAGIPLEAILIEFMLSGEIERAYRALREIGYAKQSLLHSETSQYGTLSRAERFADLDIAQRMKAILGDIASGEFAREWAKEREAGYPRFGELKKNDARALLGDFEEQVRAQFEPR